MAAKIQLQHEYEAMKREYEGAKNRRFFDREAKLMNNMQDKIAEGINARWL